MNSPLQLPLLHTKNKAYWIYPLLIIISAIFLSIFSFATSPLYIGYAADSANYVMFGRMLLAGKIPYLDFFDHKGPMIMFIEAFGETFSSNDRTGIFILQVINLSLAQIFIYQTSRQFLSVINSFSVAMISLIFFRFTMEGGNLTEEYALVFITLSLFLTVKYCLSTNNKVKPFHLLLIGICGGMLFWTRLNNMGVVCACTLFIFIVAVKNKDWKGVRNVILYFLLGFLVVSLPVIFYFIKNEALSEMFYSAFLYNFKYIDATSSESPFRSIVSAAFYILKAWVPFIVLIIGTILIYPKHKNYKLVLLPTLLFIFGWVTTHIGAAYYHYMTLNIPCLALGTIFSLYILTRNSEKKKLSLVICLLIIVPSTIIASYVYTKIDPKGDSYYISQAQDIASKIPEKDRNSVYAYQVMNRFLPSAGLLPCYKYFTMQEWQSKHNIEILIDINGMLENQTPIWVVTQFRDQSINTRFWEIIDERYNLYYKNDLFELYQLNNSEVKQGH